MDDHTFDIGYLTRLRAREPSTLTHFCDFFYLPIRNKARHECPLQDADDLVQDVFLAALKRIDAGEPEDPAKLPSYIFGICNKMLLRSWSRKKSGQNFVDVEAAVLEDVRERVDVRLDNELQARKLQQVLDKLPPKYRDVIVRIFLREEDRAVIASEYDVTAANLRLILCRALKRSRKQWDSIS